MSFFKFWTLLGLHISTGSPRGFSGSSTGGDCIDKMYCSALSDTDIFAKSLSQSVTILISSSDLANEASCSIPTGSAVNDCPGLTGAFGRDFKTGFLPIGSACHEVNGCPEVFRLIGAFGRVFALEGCWQRDPFILVSIIVAFTSSPMIVAR
eukprot:CAMPEP_0203781604 /NCGR_PEP_ID=MMETSP0099_2-20121227/10380_1 /ASSEMBLY_ACC=CAM_ASM_000209 /TAXON_ID=96639 /ORGANISM=" , Strain NY0313808BC1" /LENGTH=151 /DNA_ID=CAMNT_0050682713 /DNA_START=429 /DNA_END=884 /DNA_ORIENTATION=-